MALAAACLGRCKVVSRLACTTMMRRWETARTVAVSAQNHPRPWAAEEESKYFIRRYGTSPISPSLRDMKKLSRSTRNHNFNFVVEKAIQHYHKHIKVEEVDGPSVMIYPVRGASINANGLKLFHVFLTTTGGRKYAAIYLAPMLYSSVKMDDGALKVALFRQVDSNVPVPFDRFVGPIRWSVCPHHDPFFSAAARFALSQHNKEEKLARLVRATSQVLAGYEILRMTLEAECSSTYDAIVLVPRNSPEKMELAMIKVSDGLRMYGRHLSFNNRVSKSIYPLCQPLHVHRYDDEDEVEDEEDSECQYKDEDCVMDDDDPRATAAARFALALYKEKDQVRVEGKKDEVRRVVEATRRRYLGDEILSIRFVSELDGSRLYTAIVLAPVKDPENMRLVYCGLKKIRLDLDRNGYDDPIINSKLKRMVGFDDPNRNDNLNLKVVPRFRFGKSIQEA